MFIKNFLYQFFYYIKICKLKINFLIIFTSFIGIILSVDNNYNILRNPKIYCIILGIFFSGMSSASINNLLDATVDKQMKRTMNRPTAKNIIKKKYIVFFSILFIIISQILLIKFANFITSLLVIFCTLFYSIIYTKFLKRISNGIVIGGLSGAIPPIIGGISINGHLLQNFLYSILIFFWTPPHFWALSIFRIEEYKKTSIKILPIEKGILYTKKIIQYYVFILLIISNILFIIHEKHISYKIFIINIINIYFLYITHQLRKKILLKNIKNKSKNIFTFSIIYLIIISILLI